MGLVVEEVAIQEQDHLAQFLVAEFLILAVSTLFFMVDVIPYHGKVVVVSRHRSNSIWWCGATAKC